MMHILQGVAASGKISWNRVTSCRRLRYCCILFNNIRLNIYKSGLIKSSQSQLYFTISNYYYSHGQSVAFSDFRFNHSLH